MLTELTHEQRHFAERLCETTSSELFAKVWFGEIERRRDAPAEHDRVQVEDVLDRVHGDREQE